MIRGPVPEGYCHGLTVVLFVTRSAFNTGCQVGGQVLAPASRSLLNS